MVLQPVCWVPAFFGGALVGFSLDGLVVVGLAAAFKPPEGPPQEPGGWGPALGTCCNSLIGVPLIFGGAILGLGQTQRLFLRYVPARCPKCGGGAYCELGTPITYRCKTCGHVHATKWHAQ
jgi:hypothetical protein